MTTCVEINTDSYETPCSCDIFWLVDPHEHARGGTVFDWHERWPPSGIQEVDLLRIAEVIEEADPDGDDRPRKWLFEYILENEPVLAPTNLTSFTFTQTVTSA